jgi:hypothetical protein
MAAASGGRRHHACRHRGRLSRSQSHRARADPVREVRVGQDPETAERTGLPRLRGQVAELAKDNAFLAKTSAYSAASQRNRPGSLMPRPHLAAERGSRSGAWRGCWMVPTFRLLRAHETSRGDDVAATAATSGRARSEDHPGSAKLAVRRGWKPLCRNQCPETVVQKPFQRPATDTEQPGRRTPGDERRPDGVDKRKQRRSLLVTSPGLNYGCSDRTAAFG